MTAVPTDAEARALLGAALLERYDRDGDEACLSEAIDRFRDAIAAAPDDAVPADWLFWVGVAHVELGDRRDSVPDYDLGIAALTDVLDCLDSAPGDDGRDDAATIRMEACWRRFQLLVYGDEPADPAAEVERLLVDLDAFPVTGADPQQADLERVLHGLAHLERHLVHGDRADLDRAITALGAAARLGPDDQLRWFGRAGLVDAYVGRAELDGDAASLDLAVAEAEAALGGARPGTSGWRIVAQSLAFALQARWRSLGDPDDLDRAVDRVHGPGPVRRRIP